MTKMKAIWRFLLYKELYGMCSYLECGIRVSLTSSGLTICSDSAILSADTLLRSRLNLLSIHTLSLGEREGEREMSLISGRQLSRQVSSTTRWGQFDSFLREFRWMKTSVHSPFFQLRVHFKFHTVCYCGQQTAIEDGLQDQFHLDSDLWIEQRRHLSVIYLW